jgi:hypothetical protein
MDDGEKPNKTGRTERPKPPADPSSAKLAARALGVAAVFMVLTGVVTALAMRLADPAPHVGDIVHFDPSKESPAAAALPAMEATDGLHRCKLNPETIATQGGSFVVEKLEAASGQSEPVVVAHWAGKRTAPGVDDCGVSAELTMPVSSMRILAAAAGGYGAERGAALTASAATNAAPAID